MKASKYIKLILGVLLLSCIWNSTVKAQVKDVSGIVKNSNRQPVPGVVVKNANTENVAITNVDGTFLLSASEIDTLVFSFNQQEVKRIVRGNEDYLVISIKDVLFDEVVNVAYDKQSIKTATGAYEVLSSDKIGANSFTNTHHVVLGQLPGITTFQGSGEPGSNALDFYIRGKSTFNDNSPLILIDGFEGDFAYLSPTEIESITVLKDAVATAMYGMRGANGVILVETKKGINGKSHFNVNLESGFFMPTTLPEFVNSYEYATLVNEASQNDGLDPRYTDEQLAGYQAGNDPYNYPDINWVDEMLKDQAMYNSANMEFTGGSDQVKYYSMIGYMSAGGLLEHGDANDNYSTNTSFERINFRGNANIKINKISHLDIGIGGRIENRSDPQNGVYDILRNAYFTPSNRYVMYNPDGSYGGDNFYRNHPIADMEARGYKQRHTRYVSFNVAYDLKLDFLLKGLKAKAEASFINSFSGTEKYTASYAVYQRIESPDSTYYQQYGIPKPLGYLGRDLNQNRTNTFRAYLTYDKTVGNHEINTMLLFDQQQLVFGKNAEPERFQGVSARVKYSFKNRYIAELVAAYNGNNAYHPDKQYGFFPALGLSWIASEERFLENSSVINFLKLRASAGVTGNSLLAGYRRFMYLYNYTGNSNIIYGTGKNGYNGLEPLDIPNSDASWEKSFHANVGFDMIVLNSLGVRLDLFREQRSDILNSMDPVVSEMIGITVPRINYGEVKNSGLELAVSYNREIASDLNITLGLRGGFSRNEITKRYEQKNAVNSFIGESMNQIFGLIADGFYTEENISGGPVNTFGVVQPGDVRYKDVSGPNGAPDGVIDNYDYTPIGKTSFPEITYGFNIGADFKGVYLQLAFDGQAAKEDMMGWHYMYRPLAGGYDNISKYAAENHWTKDNPSASLPRLTTQYNGNNNRNSTLYKVDASFLRLRTAELGYNLPETIAQKVKMSGIRIFLRGHNLMVFDSMIEGIDPEVVDGYPQLRSYILGLNVNF